MSSAANQAKAAREQATKEAYEMYFKYHHDSPSDDVANMLKVTHDTEAFPMFKNVQKTGVTFATARAKAHGYKADDPTWANMGQGAPETDPIEGAPPRSYKMDITDDQIEYGPTVGIQKLREKVAAYYNHLYRQGQASQYTADNVCIVPGGRAGITRIVSILGNAQVGFFNPDYTAYEQELGLYINVTPSAYLHRDVNNALMSPQEFEFQTKGRGVSGVLLSNPCNPTGQSIEGDDLKEYVRIARDQGACLIMDEFYSHYYYDGDQSKSIFEGGADDDSNWPKTNSSAKFIEDVNKDPICIVNGFTKNWRCPGFRCCWVVAPASLVEMLGSVGSYLDGGANAPLQHLVLPLLDLDFIRRDAWALQRLFKKKRDFLLEELPKMGIQIKFKPVATFYIWGDISGLPPPLNDCLVFLEECAKHKIICVPGVFFDINPRGVKHVQRSNCIGNMRFSYGPTMNNLTVGMANMRKMIDYWTKNAESVGDYVKGQAAKKQKEFNL